MSANSETVVEDGRRSIIYIDSKLDDYGLTTRQFRVYCHMARRASSRSGEAWPSVASIAKICRMKDDSVREALSDLVSMGLLRFRDNPGKTRIYTLTDSSEWSSAASQKQTDPSGLGGVHPSPETGGDPSGLGGDEVYPLKVIQEGSGKKPVQSVAKPPPLKAETATHGEAAPGSAAPQRPKSKRARNPLMDWLAGMGGANLGEVTSSGWSGIRKVLTDIQSVSPDVTIEELERRSKNLKAKWGFMPTAQALARNWADGGRVPDSQKSPSQTKPAFIRIRELEASISSHPANFNWVGYDKDSVTDAMRAELASMRAELESLRKGGQ